MSGVFRFMVVTPNDRVFIGWKRPGIKHTDCEFYGTRLRAAQRPIARQKGCVVIFRHKVKTDD